MRARFLSFTAAVLFLSLEAGAEFFWVDADGRAVGLFVGGLGGFFTSPTGAFVDDAGLFWRLDPETATVSVLPALGSWFFAEPGCAGPAYELPAPPRQIFATVNCPLPRYRPDNVQSQLITVVSVMLNGIDCVPSEGGVVRVIPYSELLFVDAPELDARPPLHLENRPSRESGLPAR